MERLDVFVNNKISNKKYSFEIIPHVFLLIMANRKKDYIEAIINHVHAAKAYGIIAFPQLSMVDAAMSIKANSDVKVITPINALTVYLEREFSRIYK
jgi:hypothetical protein